MAIDREIRPLVSGLYDLQQIRIQMGNRVVASFRDKLGIESDKSMSKQAKIMITALRLEYDRITDGIARLNPKNFKPGELIGTFAELVLIRQYKLLCEFEDQANADIIKVVEKKPLWSEFLQGVKGVGPKMAAVILAYLDIEKAIYPSSFWAYAGLDVAKDGRGRSRRKEHLVDVVYINGDGNDAVKRGISFNPKLKTKLIGVLGPSFLKSKSEYSEIYYDYKHYIENHPAHKEKSKGHRHNMALRYMVKQFLVDLHIKWREIEGMETSRPYSEAKLGIKHRQLRISEP